MSKIAYLLGAGASYPFGIPMMREFYERFEEYIRKNRAHCVPFLEKICLGLEKQLDLEVLIERLEQVRAVRGGLNVLDSSFEGIAEDLQMADEVRGYLDMFLIETCENFDLDGVTERLSRLVDVAAKQNAYIFTTNYDRLVEVAAASRDILCTDGFAPQSSKPESAWNGQFEGGLRLIKLHGSVNWYEEEESGTLIRLERGYSLPSHEYRITHGARALRPLMIIPTLEKSILRRPYTGLLTQFIDALKEIDVLVVIGNSLRDDHLRNTITERSSGLDTLLVNPAANDQRGILKREQDTHPVPIGVDEFIEFGLQAFSVLIDDLDVMNEKAERRTRIVEFSSLIDRTARSTAGLTDLERQQLSLLEALGSDSRLRGLESLSEQPHPLILSKVRKLALSDTDDSVRVAAIDVLADARGADAAEVFETIAVAPASLAVRAEAILGLQAVADGAAIEPLNRVKSAVQDIPALSAYQPLAATEELERQPLLALSPPLS